MPLRLRDREPDRHRPEERRIGERRPRPREIVFDPEPQLVLGDGDRLFGHERPIGAAVGVGDGPRDEAGVSGERDFGKPEAKCSF
jgi:hypothetical protein